MFCRGFLGFRSRSCFFKGPASTKKRSMERSPRSAAMVPGVFPGSCQAELGKFLFGGGSVKPLKTCGRPPENDHEPYEPLKRPEIHLEAENQLLRVIFRFQPLLVFRGSDKLEEFYFHTAHGKKP